MIFCTTVSSEEELQQIAELSHQNHLSQVTEQEKLSQGFVTWHYTYDLLKQLHSVSPAVIVKDDDKVVGYALVATKESASFHPMIKDMIAHTDQLYYNSRLLSAYNYYVMGQICVDKNYRGKGLVNMMYHHHKKLFQNQYDFVVTDISTGNQRSMKAHEKVGFKTIHTYHDAMDQWNVVLWDWE